MKEKENWSRKKKYFHKRSLLINYIVEATIVYSTVVVVMLVGEIGERERLNNNRH